MLRRIPWFLRVSVLVAVVVAVSVSVFQSWSSGVPGTGGWTQTQWGPVGPADRDLLVKVRLAGLWEAPTGQQAMQQGSTAQVREIGQILASQHAELDEEVRRVADQLGVLVPSAPNAQQTGWMNEISAATGSDYDRIFIQRLREAHGIVLPVIAEVRATTRNDKIREFADVANTYVRGHIGHLEGSGLVDYTQLPDTPSPGLFSGSRTLADLIVPITVFAATLLAAVGLVVAMRRRAVARPSRIVAPPRPSRGVSAAVAAIPGPRAAEISGAHRAAPRTPGDGPDVIADLRADLPVDLRAELPADVRDTAEPPVTVTGAHRFPPVLAPGETSGSRRAHRRAVEATGPRHAVRR